jgi:HAD superfamily hydrolase (TIGR01484 family)
MTGIHNPAGKSPHPQPPTPSPQLSAPLLLVSDVDNTLTGDDAALEQFCHWYENAKGSVRLAYNSGRFPRSLAHSVRTTGLPEPDAYIGGVGTEIWLEKGVRTIFSSALEEKPKEAGQENSSDPFFRLGDWPQANGRWDPAEVREVLLAYDQLRPQPEHLLSEFKISVYGEDLDDGFIDRLRREFADQHLDVNIVYSSDRDLDVLPAGTNKGTAVAHLAQHWQIPAEHVIVAGDSGNDLDMFRQGFRGIVVGNAKPELAEFAAPHVYHAEKPFAAGVLEGLEHWAAQPT